MPAAILRAAGVGAGSRLCLALSGGLDSRVLLHQLLALRGEFSFVLSAVHVHHGLNPQADQWAAFCADLCREAGVPFRCVRVAVPRDDPAGLEAAARRLRHAALSAEPADWRVFAHHQDDQAETLLFRLARGTGVRGAAAMTAIEPAAPGESGVLRPLLAWRRARLHDYARAHGLRWVEDGSNADPRFTRNALRHQVLPALEGIFPAAVPTLARAAQNFAEAAQLLDDLAALDWQRCMYNDERGGVALAELLALDDVRVVNALRGVLQRAGAQAPARVQIRECVRQLRNSAAAALHFPFDGVALGCYRGRLWQVVATPAQPSRVWQGEVALPWPGGEVAFVPVRGQGLSRAALGGWPLELSARRAGLALRLAIGRPRRSFKNLVQEAGLPPWLRERLPVLYAGSEAVWIGGVGMAAEWRCAPGAEGVLPVWRAVGTNGEGKRQCPPYGLLLKERASLFHLPRFIARIFSWPSNAPFPSSNPTPLRRMSLARSTSALKTPVSRSSPRAWPTSPTTKPASSTPCTRSAPSSRIWSAS